jgi:hypothetical protein
MNDISIKGEKSTFFTPNISFVAATGVCEIGGESYLENTFEFYQPLIDWLKEYTETVRKPLIVNFSLSYFNTASSRSILDLLTVLKQYQEQGGSVQVNWSLKKWDEDLKQEIEDFSADADMEINVLTEQE